jgi:predicted TPR repeat methyltransferase
MLFQWLGHAVFSKILDGFQRLAVKRMFSRWAPDYEMEVTDNAYSAAQSVAQAAITHLQPSTPSTLEIADIGIGTGLLAEDVFDALPCRITGLDFNPEMLTLCSEKNIAAALYQSDLGRDVWPLKDKSFDAVISAGLFEYLTKDMALHVIKESARILKPQGWLIFTYIPEQKKDFHAALWNGHSGRFLTCGYKPCYIEHILQKSGFKILDHSDDFDGSIFEDGSRYPYRMIAAQKTR